VYADINDLESLQGVCDEYQPEIIFHLAAQPLVRESYRDPVWTFQTNVMGTVHVLEAIRQTESIK
jgi:CDP-glucose 4,6-dehydratase